MVLNDPRLADRTLLCLAAKMALARRQAPPPHAWWEVGVGLSSLLRAFPDADEDREPLDVDTSTGLGKLLAEARLAVRKERGHDSP